MRCMIRKAPEIDTPLSRSLYFRTQNQHKTGRFLSMIFTQNNSFQG